MLVFKYGFLRCSILFAKHGSSILLFDFLKSFQLEFHMIFPETIENC